MNDTLGTETAPGRSAQGALQAGDVVSSTSPAVRATKKRRRGRARMRLEITLLSGPAIIMFLAFVIFPVVLAAFYSKRVTARGAVAAIASGTIVTLAWDLPGVKSIFPHIIADRDAIFPALFVAVASLVIVSLFTPAPTQSQLAQVAD